MAAEGRSCLEHSDCYSGYCHAARCAANVEGKPCASSTATCPPGTICHSATKYCLSSGFKLPKSCQHTRDCPWGRFCNKYNQCVDKFEVGHECSRERQCAERLACVERTCTPKCVSSNDCEKTYDCVKKENEPACCRPQLDVPSSPEILPLPIVLLALFVTVVMLILILRLVWRVVCRRRPPRDIGLVKSHRNLSSDQSSTVGQSEEPRSLIEPTPVRQRPMDEIVSVPVIAKEASPNVLSATPRKYEELDLPTWPETTIKLPDPFDEDITHTPIERKEFSSPLNIAAPIHAGEKPSVVLPKDPSLDSQSVWQ